MTSSTGALGQKKRFAAKKTSKIKQLFPRKVQTSIRLALNTARAAKYLDISESLLRKMREHGNGPRYAKLNSKIVYPVAELVRFLEDNLVKRG